MSRIRAEAIGIRVHPISGMGKRQLARGIVHHGQTLAHIGPHAISNDGLITFPGRVPIKNGQGLIVGAIGVSGSTVENDHTVAQAGAAAVC